MTDGRIMFGLWVLVLAFLLGVVLTSCGPSVFDATPRPTEPSSGAVAPPERTCHIYPNGRDFGYWCSGLATVTTGAQTIEDARAHIEGRFPGATIVVDKVNCLAQRNADHPDC